MLDESFFVEMVEDTLGGRFGSIVDHDKFVIDVARMPNERADGSFDVARRIVCQHQDADLFARHRMLALVVVVCRIGEIHPYSSWIGASQRAIAFLSRARPSCGFLKTVVHEAGKHSPGAGGVPGHCWQMPTLERWP